MGLAWSIAYQIFSAQVEDYGDSKGISFFFWGNFISAWLGAKAFFLLFSAGEQTTQFLVNQNFWLGGGFVFYGGLIGASAFTLIIIFGLGKFSINNLRYCPPALAIGHGIGRLGCFLTGCCFGGVCERPWSVFLHGAYRHPVQLYESFLLFIIGLFLFKKAKDPKFPMVAVYITFYSVTRFILEFFRADSIRGVFSGVSTSQLISIVLFIIGIALFLLNRRTND